MIGQAAIDSYGHYPSINHEKQGATTPPALRTQRNMSRYLTPQESANLFGLYEEARGIGRDRTSHANPGTLPPVALYKDTRHPSDVCPFAEPAREERGKHIFCHGYSVETIKERTACETCPRYRHLIKPFLSTTSL